MNEIVTLPPQQAVDTYGGRSMTAADVQAQVNLMQDVMRKTMFDGTHYGKIPGTQSVSLYKAGAEKLMATFRLAADPETEDLSRDGEIHYRVKVRMLSASGQFLGAGIGECSSREDKYAWRAMVCQEEFDATPENRRRVKFAKYSGRVEQKKQVRTNPSDVANTILKMAKKRAQVDAVITVTAATDIFTQDIEDLPDELRDQVAEDARSRARPGVQAAERVAPVDSPERDLLIADMFAVADMGSASLKDAWEKIGRDKRLLLGDKLADFKARAELADAAHSEPADAPA